MALDVFVAEVDHWRWGLDKFGHEGPVFRVKTSHVQEVKGDRSRVAGEVALHDVAGTLRVKHYALRTEVAYLQWVFPSKSLGVDPQGGTIRRHHVHDNTISKALAVASKRSGQTKKIKARTLRHSYATAHA